MKIKIAGILFMCTLLSACFDNPTQITNTHHPLVPGTTYTYEGEDAGGEAKRLTIEVLADTGEINDVETVMVKESSYADGELEEVAHSLYAQDNFGNVWLLGEQDITEYEYDDEGNLAEAIEEDGWAWGDDAALMGVVMLKEPKVGDRYPLEQEDGEIEEIAEVTAIDVAITTTAGATYSTVEVSISEIDDLEEILEKKYYAPGVGLVREVDIEDEEQLDLISVTSP